MPVRRQSIVTSFTTMVKSNKKIKIRKVKLKQSKDLINITTSHSFLESSLRSIEPLLELSLRTISRAILTTQRAPISATPQLII